jgi:hypothetical protein
MHNIAKIRIRNFSGEKIIKGKYIGVDNSDKDNPKFKVEYKNQILYFNFKTKKLLALTDFISDSAKLVGVEFDIPELYIIEG